jgi:2-C-methyl-D-erythritol 2,4-cyclodiphosphate synthase
MRIGLGYDVHALAPATPERRLVIGGMTIDSPYCLLGHSDADVLTHAVMDALLGAARLGDIGERFPDTDPRYEGADSIALLREVARLLDAQGWIIEDVDCVVICEQPKVAPLKEGMRARLAEAMGVGAEQVGVKGTTTERLGFAGRGEGIAAQAVALLERAQGL